MIKFISISIGISICCIVLFSKCKSNGDSNAEAAKKELAKSLNKDSLRVANELNKYLIQPPDSDYTGDYIDKYPNGVIKFTGTFRFGLRHGQWMAFYENGLKWSECFYDKGKKHGSTMVYHPNGELYYSGWYKQDQKDSLWIFYNDKGKEIDKHAYRMGIETGLVN